MTGRLKDKTAIVIGSARGIGAGIAEVFAAEGAKARHRRRPGGRRQGHRRPPGGARRRPCPSPWTSAARPTTRRWSRPRWSTSAASTSSSRTPASIPLTLIADIDPAEWDRVLAVNLKGVFLAFQACLRPMQAQRYGRCVFTASITGPRVTAPGHGHYSASKAGIVGFIRAAALEAAPYGITVNGLEPGNILTEGMTLHRSPEFIRAMEAAVPLGRLGTPRDVGQACAFLASDEAAFITGTTLVIDGGQIIVEAKT